MKKILALTLFALLIAVPVFGIEWHTANQTTVAWDASDTVPDQGERIAYVCYLTNANTDPDKQNPVEVGETIDTTILITLNTKGSYIVGVKSVLQVAEDGSFNPVSESEVVWSDDPQYAQGGVTFGLRFYPAPNVVTNLRPE